MKNYTKETTTMVRITISGEVADEGLLVQAIATAMGGRPGQYRNAPMHTINEAGEDVFERGHSIIDSDGYARVLVQPNPDEDPFTVAEIQFTK